MLRDSMYTPLQFIPEVAIEHVWQDVHAMSIYTPV